jgi:hypothetical protein
MERCLSGGNMRLIDADKINFNEVFVGASEFAQDTRDVAQILINRQPTAYDVDKVVKRLEELKSQVPVNRILDDIIKDKPKELGQLIAYNKAIEIVKAGVKENG